MQDSRNDEKAKAPAWTWAFVAACGAIPIVSLGGAIPGVLGGLGAMACYGLARDGKGAKGRRVLYCGLVTIVAWGAFGTLALVMTSGNGERKIHVQRASSGSTTSRTIIRNGKVVSVEQGRAERKDFEDLTEDERREIYSDAASDRGKSHVSFVASHNKLTKMEVGWILDEGDAASWPE